LSALVSICASAREATATCSLETHPGAVSIHAFREVATTVRAVRRGGNLFQSTPSRARWRHIIKHTNGYTIIV
jgi:hypothetical protein